MEVILLEKVIKLGNVGDVIAVKSGYARNYLIPNSKCLRATEANKKIFEEKKAHLQADSLAKKQTAKALLKDIENKEIIMIRKAGESGHLYGSVKPSDIVTVLAEQNINVDKKQIAILAPIKMLGVVKVAISLHPEVVTHILLNIAREVDESIMQMKSYLDVKNGKNNSEAVEEETRRAYETQATAMADNDDATELQEFEEIKDELKKDELK